MKKLLYILISFITIIACKEKKQSKINVLKGTIFGTYYIIKYNHTHLNSKTDLQKGIDSVFNKINKSLNTYIPDSDISKINKGDTTIVTDKLFKDVFKLSEKIYKQTNGYFDPTIGNLRNAYGFGDTKPLKNISQKQLDSILQYTGLQKVKLLTDGKITKLHPQIYLDFNAIAKGYAVDKIIEYFNTAKVEDISVEIGGEVRVKGKNPTKNKAWSIGIESVNSKTENRTTRAIIALKNKAIAGSGNFRKNRTDPISGKKYVHTINPLTGKAEQGNILSAYVIANTCAEADGYATALMAMDIEKSKKITNSLKNIDAYLVYSDEKGNIKTFITKGFQKIILE